jgi:hypothetical protein
VVEILEQAETIDLRKIGIRLMLCDAGGDLNRHLLETNSGL